MTTLPEPPADTRIHLAATGDSVSVAVPPSGWKGPGGVMLLIGTVFFSISVFIGGGLITALTLAHFGGDMLPLIAVAPFFLIGLGLMLSGIQVARRRAVLLLTPDTVVFSQIGPIRRSETSWPRGEIQDVCVDFSGVTVNNRRLQQVQIVKKSGERLRMFTGWSDAELGWICATLRQALGLQLPVEPPVEASIAGSAQDEPPADDADPPADDAAAQPN